MNSRVVTACVVFAATLTLWLLLAYLDKPTLADALTFVKGACFTSWTAVALFFDLKGERSDPAPVPAPVSALAQARAAAASAGDRPPVPGAHPE